MKHVMTAIMITALGLTMAWGADQKAPETQGQAPHAWGDKDHDGKCDVTGKPVGQGRQAMGGGMAGRMAGRMAMGGGRGMRGGMGMMAQRTSGSGQGAGECCQRGCGRGRHQAAPEPEKK